MNRTSIKDGAEAAEAGFSIGREARAVAIARDNDAFRAAMGCAPGLKGRTLFTAGLRALGGAAVTEAFAKVRDYADFNEGDDPYGERDFGAFDVKGERILWKLDYFADADCDAGSEDPSDPAQTFRVLTVMRAREW